MLVYIAGALSEAEAAACACVEGLEVSGPHPSSLLRDALLSSYLCAAWCSALSEHICPVSTDLKGPASSILLDVRTSEAITFSEPTLEQQAIDEQAGDQLSHQRCTSVCLSFDTCCVL